MTQRILHQLHRTVVRIGGPERVDFLNGLVTNQLAKLCAGEAVYAGLLTPQGKFLFDMIIFTDGEALYLDVERARVADLVRKLTLYKLRADVTVEDLSDSHSVWSSTEPLKAALSAPDPRSARLGWRSVSDAAPAGADWPSDEYEGVRLVAGVPDGSRDIAVEKFFWPETNAEALNGTSYTKGCYVGQELVSRLKHRTEVKRLILPAQIAGGAPEHGTDIVTAEGKRAGTVLTSQGGAALVYLRLEYRDHTLLAADKTVTLSKTMTETP